MYIGLIKISISPHTVNDHILSGLRLTRFEGQCSFFSSVIFPLFKCFPWVLDSCFYGRSTYIVLQVLWRFFVLLAWRPIFNFGISSVKFVSSLKTAAVHQSNHYLSCFNVSFRFHLRRSVFFLCAVL